MLSIPVRAWATGSLPAWPVKTVVLSAATGFTATLADATLSSGATTNLQVSAPAGAPSGTFAVIDIWSDRPTPPPGGMPYLDGGHRNIVGVYLP
jgi:hypothetical protein